MNSKGSRVRVLYSFPHKIGAGRICHTAWQQVNGLTAAGAAVHVHAASFEKAFPQEVEIKPTLARGKVRIPYRVIGSTRAFDWHDRIVARRLEKLAGEIDVVHTWPMGALETLKTAKRLGIPTVLERPNAHTRYAYEVVQQECERLGVALPPDHEHAYKQDVLAKEEAEYRLADRLLCPSDFVARTFLGRGFSREKLARHNYGYDESIYKPNGSPRADKGGLTMLFVGVCAVRKGLHFALEAWLQSPASATGTFTIAGEFLPSYEEKLSTMLAHPSVRVLGHRKDIPDLMHKSDALVLPSIEEGSALVTSEARGSGCVLLVSEAAGAICKHMENGLVHSVGDVSTLSQQITMLHENRQLLETLRTNSLRTTHEITWTAAGRMLLEVYRETIEMKKREART
jgi:glycosyltransferase involved in cell wall biosynthesis